MCYVNWPIFRNIFLLKNTLGIIAGICLFCFKKTKARPKSHRLFFQKIFACFCQTYCFCTHNILHYAVISFTEAILCIYYVDSMPVTEEIRIDDSFQACNFQINLHMKSEFGFILRGKPQC